MFCSFFRVLFMVVIFLCSGVLVPGGFGIRGVEGKILAAEWARKMKKPFLGTLYNIVKT